MLYLSGTSTPGLREQIAAGRPLGHMWTKPAYTEAQHVAGAPWAADNGCFSGPFREEEFFGWLRRMEPHRDTCLFAVSPDVFVNPEVGGDAQATYELALHYLPVIRAAGYPAAYVLQNGQEHFDPPWGMLDAVFVGGNNPWKLGQHACDLVQEALARGKWAHMGRVNGGRRLRRARDWGCQSADGNKLRFHPTDNLPLVLGWLDRLEVGQDQIRGVA